MTNSSLYSWLPSSTDEYRRWYIEHLPESVEFGTCWCGCGRATDRARQTAVRDLRFKGEPVRFIRGHSSSTILKRISEYKAWWSVNTNTPYGYCWCGCGRKTQGASLTRFGGPTPYLKGQPTRYINGHHKDVGSMSLAEYKDFWQRNSAAPYGYCWCGCGARTSISEFSSTVHQHVRGEPRRYVHGHATRGQFSDADARLHYTVENRGYETPCWIWQGSTTGGDYPYGRIRINGKLALAHRYIYQQQNGAVDPRNECHHLCEITLCCNPAHIADVTKKQHRQLHAGAR